MLVECSDGRGCGEACDNIGDCHDDSDEHVNLCRAYFLIGAFIFLCIALDRRII